MRRREFIAALGGAAAWPVMSRAQQSDRVRRIGVLMAFNDDDARAKSWLARFTSGMAELGWTNGHNLQMEIRWAGADVARMHKALRFDS